MGVICPMSSACLGSQVYHTVKGRFGVPESFLTRICRTPQRLSVSPLTATSSLELRVLTTIFSQASVRLAGMKGGESHDAINR